MDKKKIKLSEALVQMNEKTYRNDVSVSVSNDMIAKNIKKYAKVLDYLKDK